MKMLAPARNFKDCLQLSSSKPVSFLSCSSSGGQSKARAQNSICPKLIPMLLHSQLAATLAPSLLFSSLFCCYCARWTNGRTDGRTQERATPKVSRLVSSEASRRPLFVEGSRCSSFHLPLSSGNDSTLARW